ncbi:MAG: polyphosphate polymerase domain-containing protein [Clostridia bacterium]|nr:polyphosphate polymerase domain-containing protein [Clostridia bacterium]
MEESFARVETKYMLTPAQEAAMERGLRAYGFRWMDFGSPAVQSLYYDTAVHQLIRTSLDRPAYKEKLRLRTYGLPGAQTMSFVEVKKKYNGVVYKRRTALPFAEAYHCLAKGQLPEETGQVGREAVWMVKRYGLIPSTVIAYDRHAWFSNREPDIRITFDRNLAFRTFDLNLASQAENTVFTQPDQRLMEIKTGGVYPLWLTRLLEEVGAERIHYSKYGYAYQHYIAQKDPAGERSDETCLKAFFPKAV